MGSKLLEIKEDMHDRVKIQILSNILAYHEKKLIQHEECFGWEKNATLNEDEHADQDPILFQFTSWKQDKIKFIAFMDEKAQQFTDTEEKFNELIKVVDDLNKQLHNLKQKFNA